MSARGWWISLVAVGLAVALWIVFAVRGPVSDRAPARRAGAADGAGEDGATATGRVRIAVRVVPPGTVPEWTLEMRDSAGVVRQEGGSGEREFVVDSLPEGRARCSVRARGFLGETSSLEIGQDAEATLTLRQFGRVAGVVRCDGAPVSGLLVRIAMPAELASVRLDVMPEERGAGTEQAVETDANGRYRFDRVPPGPGYSLVAAGFDHSPVHAGPVESRPGEETTLDITVVAGVHLSGRVVDARGAPASGATVNILRRHDKRGAITWSDEARARADEDGRFLTPALTGPAMRMLKAWIVVDGLQQVIQLEVSPPERGTRDVGTLAPHPGVVSFEIEGPFGDRPATLTVVVLGDPPGVGQAVTLTGAAFDREGRIRMAGLPIGEGTYSAMSGDARAFSDGKFRTTGSDMIVRIPKPVEIAARPPPAEKLIIDIAPLPEPAFLILLFDGSFVMCRRVETGNRDPIVERVAPGDYTLVVCAGDRYGRKEIVHVAGQDLRTSIVPDRIGRSVTVVVLDEGKPVPGATVSLRGFRGDARGEHAPWAEAGPDGRAILRGLPPDVAQISITAMGRDVGRGRSLDISGRDEVTVDLAESPAHD